MTRYRSLVTFALATVLIAASVAIGGQPSSAAGGATLSPAVATWLASAPVDATFRTIVTFHDRAGLARIDSLGVTAQKLEALPIAFATLTAAQLRAVGSWPETRSLWHDAENRFSLDESLTLIGVDKVKAGTKLRRAYSGAGIGVAVIDTGIDSTHPDVANAKSYAVVGDAFDPKGVVVQAGPTIDTYGHGTHVTSTIAGLGAASTGRFAGVAPGATVHSFKTDAGAVLVDSWALASFDWILAHPEANIRVSSNSWGSGDGTTYNPDDPINVTTKIMYDRGITVVFAASNSGGPNTLNQYATSPWVVSVAAGDKQRKLASFSSRGRIDDNWDRSLAQAGNTGIYRPTLTATGVDIEAAKSTQAVVMADGVDPENPMYTTASGTSMAAPHVAGTVALMLEARPGLRPADVIAMLEGTAVAMPGYEVFEVGRGYLDAYASTKAAERGQTKFRPSAGQTAGYTLASEQPYSGVVLTNTWVLASCPDTTGLLNHHPFTVGSGLGALYVELEWASVTDLIYLRLYAPDCTIVGESAGLLDAGTLNYRAIAYTNPAPGTYTVGVYGRINAPTQYTGTFSTYTKN